MTTDQFRMINWAKEFSHGYGNLQNSSIAFEDRSESGQIIDKGGLSIKMEKY
jgi:hypothetical protein